MATTFVGATPWEITAPAAGNDTRIRLFLADSADPTVGKTGIAFGAVTCHYCKPGEASFTDFPTFDTDNWAELGLGWYCLIIRQSDATELALLNALGDIVFDVAATGCITQKIIRRVVSGDTLRLAANLNFAGGTQKTIQEALQVAWAQGKGRWHLAGTTLTLYEPDGSTALITFTLDDGTTPTERTPA
jgi:hypothetical protein